MVGTVAHGDESDAVIINVSGDKFAEEKGDLQQLEKDLRITQSKAYASGTLKNLACQWRSFRCFSFHYNIFDWPVQPHTICLFAQFLAYSLHSVKAVRNDIDGVRKVHILLRAEPPTMADIEVRITLLGLNKTMLCPVKQVAPITPEIMLDMVTFLDLTKRADLVFWLVIVVGFFTFFRKSNLIPDSKESFDPMKQLTRSDVQFDDTLAILNVSWSKTIQYRQRVVEVPLFPIPGSPLCLVTLVKVLMACKGKPHHPLFALKGGVPLTYHTFQKRLRNMLQKAGNEKVLFSSHSLHRGATLWAFRSGVSERLIQVQGDRTSDAYKRYLSFPVGIRAVINLKMRQAIQ